MALLVTQSTQGAYRLAQLDALNAALKRRLLKI
jgi:hypothetical protein